MTKTYDNYEISPCTRTEEPGKPGHFYFEVCEPHEAHVWTLYGHLPEGGVEAIGDFATREAAEQAFQRITGIPFGSHDEIADRLRVMHAGPLLLTNMQFTREWFTANELENDYHAICDHLDAAIAAATGKEAA